MTVSSSKAPGDTELLRRRRRLQPVDGAPPRGALRAIFNLSPRDREVILLIDQHELSYEEAAALLRVPRTTVTSWTHRARRRMRRALVIP